SVQGNHRTDHTVPTKPPYHTEYICYQIRLKDLLEGIDNLKAFIKSYQSVWQKQY
ncbi:34423_t:CDS:2, partial [Racocetra persica]